MSENIEKRSWEEFKNSKLLWWTNRTLHLFGWAIVYSLDKDDNIIEVYPARVTYRGFTGNVEVDGYLKLTKYLNKNINALVNEVEDTNG